MLAQHLGSGLYEMIQKGPSEYHVHLGFEAVSLFLSACASASLFLVL